METADNHFFKHLSDRIACIRLAAEWGRRDDGIENIEVVLVAFGWDLARFDGGFYSAAGLVAVRAVGETAREDEGTHLGKEMGELPGLEINHAEFFDAWGIDEERRGLECGGWIADVRLVRGALLRRDADRVDFSESGGMGAFKRPLRDLTGAEVERGVDGVEEGGLAHAAMAGEKDCLAGDELL